jgi:DNA mismatch repair protein MutS2
VRAELDDLRAEIRAARRLERQRGRASTPAASEKERQRDRRLGAAADRAAGAQRALSRLDEPVRASAPLAPGDPVVAPDVGVRGTIAEITGDEATVLGSGGLRVKVRLERLQPSREPALPAGAETPAVTVRAMVQNDIPDELDLRGRTAQDAREAVRDLVDQAALAGRHEVRVIHGRGTGAVRKAVRDELARHPLVEEQVPDSADGATVVRLGGG